MVLVIIFMHIKAQGDFQEYMENAWIMSLFGCLQSDVAD